MLQAAELDGYRFTAMAELPAYLPDIRAGQGHRRESGHATRDGASSCRTRWLTDGGSGQVSAPGWRAVRRRSPAAWSARAEHVGQLALDRVEHVGHRHRLGQAPPTARSPRVGNAARHDPVEPGQVVVAVEREPVHGHAARHPDPDGADLAVLLGASPRDPRDPDAAAAVDPPVASPASAQVRISASSIART